MLKVDVQSVPLNLRLNLGCEYYCESLSLTLAGPTFANSDGEVSSEDEDSTQKKRVQFTVTRERAEELISSLCGVIWKQKSHSWSEVCTGVAAVPGTSVLNSSHQFNVVFASKAKRRQLVLSVSQKCCVKI